MVICKKCGNCFDEKYEVCPKCGTTIDQLEQETKYTYDMPAQISMSLADSDKTKKKTNFKLITIISVSVIVIIGIIVVLIMLFSQPNKQAQIDEQISLGEKYLTEENYEEAIVAFKKAIEIEPNSPEPYIKLADAYIAKGDKESAISTLQEGYEKTQSATIKAKLDSLTEVESEISFEESSEESTTISKSEEEKIALQEYADNMEKSIKIKTPVGYINWEVSQYEVIDLNNDGSYELITQYKSFDDYEPSYALGVYLKIFKYQDGNIKEYKTFNNFEDTLDFGGQWPHYYWYINELYIDKETNNYIILTRDIVCYGTSPADYEYIYTANILSDSALSQSEKWSLEYKYPQIDDYSYMKNGDIAIFGENDYRSLYFKFNDQSISKTEYIDNLNNFNSSALICDKYHINSNEINEPPYNTFKIIDVEGLQYITYDEFVKKYNQ